MPNTSNYVVATGMQVPQASLSLLNTMNAAIRAVPTPLTAIVEAANQAMSAVDSDVWTAPTRRDGCRCRPYFPASDIDEGKQYGNGAGVGTLSP